MSKMFVVALDTGNGDLKIKSDAVPRLRVGGVLGKYEDAKGKAKTAKENNVNIYKVEGIDQEWVVGHEDVNHFRLKPLSVTGREGMLRYKQQLYTVYGKIGLVKALGSKRPSKVILVTSTTAKDALDNEVVEYLTDMFKDVHKVKQNEEKVLTIVQEYVPLSETEAALYDVYLDEDGYVADEKIENQDVLVINAGFGTTDISRYNGLEYIKLEKETINVSYLDVIKRLKTYVDGVLKKDIPREEIARQLDQQINQVTKKFLYVEEEVPGFNDEYYKAVDSTYEDLFADLKVIVEDPDIYPRIIVVGGPAEETIWGKKFKQWSRRVEIPADPQFAATRGMYNYGKYLANELADSAAASEE